MANLSSVDRNSLDHFNPVKWWDTKNIFHLMNTLRVPFIRDGVIESGQIKSNLVKSEKPFENLSILDIGCGGGILSEPIARFGGKVIGIDVGAEVVKVAKNHAELDSTLTNLTYLNESLDEHCERHSDKYDVIIASEVMEHVYNPEWFLIQSLECLKPGGSIFITTINQTVASLIMAIYFYEKVLGIIENGTHEHGKFISPTRITEVLEKHNCYVKSIRGMKYNIFSRTMEWTDSTSIFYAVHAIKKN